MAADSIPTVDRRSDRSSDALSDQQKTCLRLVSRGMSSKEIAAETGLAPQTIDTYLKLAMSRLGVSSRRDAARMLEAAESPQKSGSPSQPVAALAATPQSAFEADRRLGAFALLPPIGGTANRLSSASRTYAALRVAAVSAMTVIGIALLMAGAFRAFH